MAQVGADGINIYSGTQKMCGGHVATGPVCGIVDTRSGPFVGDGYDIRDSGVTGKHKT